MDRHPAICGVLLLLACGGDDPTDPTETVDPGPARFEAVGDYYLHAVVDSLTCGHNGCTARTVGSYADTSIGLYTLLVGPGGKLSLYTDSTYWLAYTEKMFISLGGGAQMISTGVVDIAGRWTATGTMYDSLSFTDDMYRIEILRGVLRGESARRTTTNGATRITPLYVDLYLDQPFAMDSVYNLEQGVFRTVDTVFELTFRVSY
ncbi:hypothetical protein LCGC14_1807480 [marine sediment metagenome]|uniref:Uncharacterized protein n=1 Tax=marine sediment metagenome TaxID=412755 RepID=A0A0F9HAS1_9ZZZZ